MDVILYTDGSARGNPNGPGGYGAVLQFIDAKGQLHEREYSQGYIKTTNNRMELMAAIVGLEALIKPCNVKLYSDSQYLCNAFNQHWIEGWIKKAGSAARMNRSKTGICGNVCLQQKHHTTWNSCGSKVMPATLGMRDVTCWQQQPQTAMEK